MNQVKSTSQQNVGKMQKLDCGIKLRDELTLWGLSLNPIILHIRFVYDLTFFGGLGRNLVNLTI